MTYIEETAKEMGLRVFTPAGGDIYVSTPFGGHWKIVERNGGYLVEHENYHLGGACRRGTYHKHARRYPSPKNALEYIKAHDESIPFRKSFA